MNDPLSYPENPNDVEAPPTSALQKYSSRQCTNVINGVRCTRIADKGKKMCEKCLIRRTGSIDSLRYSQLLKTTTLSAYFESFAKDTEYQNLREEIALSRTFLAAALEKISGVEAKDLTNNSMIMLQMFVDSVAKVTELNSKILFRMEATLTVSDLYQIVNQIQKIITYHVKDPDIIAAIVNDFEDLVVPDK